MYLLGKVVMVLISMNEKHFIDRCGHEMVELLGALKDLLLLCFTDKNNLSPRKRKPLVPLISGRIETNIIIALPFGHQVLPLSSLY